MTSVRRLYALALDPGCREVKIVLAEKQLDYVLADPHAQDGLMEVPQLSDETGVVLPYASVIGEYLEEAYPLHTLLGEDTLARAEVRRLWRFFSNEMGERVTRPILFEKVHKRISGLGAPDSQTLIRANQAKAYFLDQIEGLFGHRRWLAGGYFSFADVAAAAQVSVLDYVNLVEWPKYGGLRDWYALVKSRPSLRAVLDERIEGLPPPAHYRNPDF